MFSKYKRVRICEKYAIMSEGWFEGGGGDVGGRNCAYVIARIYKLVNYHFAQSSGTYS